MQETKQVAAHTPGPWRTDWLNRREGRIVRGDGLVCIAELPLWREEFKEELDANARLIAAAPDLLLTLETIEAATDGLSSGLAVEINRSAKAAIQKARGVK